MNYFNIEEYINENTHRYYIVGRRGCGKSYSIKRYLLKRFIKYKEKFILIKQTTPDITTQKMNVIFSDVINDNALDFTILGYGDFERYHILFKAGEFWLVGETPDGGLEWLTSCGIATPLSMGNRFKGGVYNDYKNIFYDEFINENYVGFDEVGRFNKILLTVARAGVNNNVMCFFAGNPDAGIERSGFLFPLKLDYKHITNYTPYYYDTKIAGKIYANNILFIKLAGDIGESFIDVSAIDVNNGEIDMSLSGEVKTNKYYNIKPDDTRYYSLDFEMIVETPIMTPNEYYKKIYAYIGTFHNQPFLLILSHRKFTGNIPRLYCRYVSYDIRPRECVQTYRLNIPACYSAYKSVLNDIINTQFIATDNDSNATLFFDILVNG